MNIEKIRARFDGKTNDLRRIGCLANNPKFVFELIVDGNVSATYYGMHRAPGKSDFDYLLHREYGVTLGEQNEFYEEHDIKIKVFVNDDPLKIFTYENNEENEWEFKRKEEIIKKADDPDLVAEIPGDAPTKKDVEDAKEQLIADSKKEDQPLPIRFEITDAFLEPNENSVHELIEAILKREGLWKENYEINTNDKYYKKEKEPQGDKPGESGHLCFKYAIKEGEEVVFSGYAWGIVTAEELWNLYIDMTEIDTSNEELLETLAINSLL